MNKITNWIMAHMPVWCIRCGYVMFAKNAIYRRTTTGKSVPLCSKCDRELYRLFEEVSK